MKYCGLKLTHDGAIALIEDNQLVFCFEMEKIANNKRYTGIDDTATIATYLKQQGNDISNTKFIVDGWGGYDAEALAIQPRLAIGADHNVLDVANLGKEYKLNVAQYQERSANDNVLSPLSFSGLHLNGAVSDYSTYLHVTGHILSAYCTSPFARRGESSFVLVWDGGMYPQLYYFDADTKSINNLGPIFLLVGNVYTIFSQHFGPFKVSGNFAKDNLSVAGKVMAYIALGTPRRELFPIIDNIISSSYNHPMGFANVLANQFKEQINGKWSDEDVLTTFHYYLEELLVAKLTKKMLRVGKGRVANLCFCGGCALNIKWNSAIREARIFNDVFVPPFPNDSGSAIGMACAGMIGDGRDPYVNWNVYSGPQIIKNEPAEGWSSKPCDVTELARLLFESGEPVVFLNGRAELGPRALGNRSIIARAEIASNKEKLNKIKQREHYRPVSPICLEDASSKYFLPGTPDPFMLFDHQVKEEFLSKIPAVCHLDNTARLQTVNENQNPVVFRLLREYERLSGIGLLCNTSANYNGSGFFPDVYSATAWGQTKYVWCEGTLFTNNRQM